VSRDGISKWNPNQTGAAANQTVKRQSKIARGDAIVPSKQHLLLPYLQPSSERSTCYYSTPIQSSNTTAIMMLMLRRIPLPLLLSLLACAALLTSRTGTTSAFVLVVPPRISKQSQSSSRLYFSDDDDNDTTTDGTAQQQPPPAKKKVSRWDELNPKIKERIVRAGQERAIANKQKREPELAKKRRTFPASTSF